MLQLNKFLKENLLRCLLICMAVGSYNASLAQCPVNATCAPSGNASTNIPSTGIFNVKLNTLNKTTAGVTTAAPQIYSNFACSDGTSLVNSVPYTISVTTGSSIGENVRIWIDYNNNGTFDATSELAFSSNNKTLHTGSITVPSTAVRGTPLRMRVSADVFTVTAPLPCTNSSFSQVEDYKVTVTANTQPPLARFRVSGDSVTCDGVLTFLDLSQNAPTTWFWDFGDGTTDTEQNPQHVYNSAGLYTVKLKVSNANGIDSILKTNYINFNDTVPRLADCNPISLSSCCGYGITRVVFNTIDQTSAANAGYENFTCKRRAYVFEGRSYPISITTSANDNQDTRVYLDLNDDGIFTESERVLVALNTKSPSGNITIPSNGVVRDRALRFRIWSDYAGAPFSGSCTNPVNGQVEDYTVIIRENTLPPVAAFTVSSGACSPTFTFTNQSQNRIDTLKWNFGDGNTLITTSLQPITHTYTTAGAYNVTLKVISIFGENETIKANAAVYVQSPVAASCTPQTTSTQGGMGIVNVTFNTINNNTGNSVEGYGNFTCEQVTSVTVGSSYTLSVSTSSFNNPQNVRAWIDYNNNGVFADNELVLDANGVIESIPTTATFTIPGGTTLNKNLRMRVISNFDGFQAPTPCGAAGGGGNQLLGQAEDYGVVILPNTVPPVANFLLKSIIACNTAAFRDTSSNLPTSWLWKFGDGNISTQQYPTHTYTNTGNYTVTLIVSNAFGIDSIVKTNLVTIIESQGLKPADCIPVSTAATGGGQDFGLGILNLTFAGINNTSGTTLADGGYRDFSCTQRGTVTAGNTYNISVITGVQFGEAVRVWIDYNYNGVFDANELTFSKDDVGDPGSPKTGTITIPNNAVANKALRMRVSSNYWAQPFTDPCETLSFGQSEDYSVFVLPNNLPPIATYNNVRQACSRTVKFTDNSSNQPTSWLWKFDAINNPSWTSTEQSPVYTYATPGVYAARLIIQNTFGKDSIQKTITIGVATTTSTILPTSCTFASTQPTQNVGITNVKLGTINNTTGTGIVTYNDYSCTQSTTLIAGGTYTLSVTLGNQFFENLRAWIDYNNDGVLDNTTELVLTKSNVNNVQTGTFTIPASAPLQKDLRLRVTSDFTTGSWDLTPCGTPQYGQIEDYAVVFQENTQPPLAGFSTVTKSICLGKTITFADTSKNIPTSWLWDFGDGSTSTLQNPTHTYAAVGNYTVTLAVANNFGTNNTVKTNYVVVNPNVSLVTACEPITIQPLATTGIFRLKFDAIDNTTVGSTDGYQNYACAFNTEVVLGEVVPIEVTTGTAQNESIRIWVDYNNNGTFETNENAFNSINRPTNHTGNITIPATAVTNQYLRFRVISDRANSPIQNACQNRTNGQIEDYAIRITPVSIKNNLLAQALKVYPNPSAGVFHLELPVLKPSKVGVSVANVLGQQVYEAQTQADEQLQHTIDLSQAPKGVYFVKVQIDGRFATQKIVVE